MDVLVKPTSSSDQSEINRVVTRNRPRRRPTWGVDCEAGTSGLWGATSALERKRSRKKIGRSDTSVPTNDWGPDTVSSQKDETWAGQKPSQAKDSNNGAENNSMDLKARSWSRRWTLLAKSSSGGAVDVDLDKILFNRNKTMSGNAKRSNKCSNKDENNEKAQSESNVLSSVTLSKPTSLPRSRSRRKTVFTNSNMDETSVISTTIVIGQHNQHAPDVSVSKQNSEASSRKRTRITKKKFTEKIKADVLGCTAAQTTEKPLHQCSVNVQSKIIKNSLLSESNSLVPDEEVPCESDSELKRRSPRNTLRSSRSSSKSSKRSSLVTQNCNAKLKSFVEQNTTVDGETINTTLSIVSGISKSPVEMIVSSVVPDLLDPDDNKPTCEIKSVLENTSPRGSSIKPSKDSAPRSSERIRLTKQNHNKKQKYGDEQNVTCESSTIISTKSGVATTAAETAVSLDASIALIPGDNSACERKSLLESTPPSGSPVKGNGDRSARNRGRTRHGKGINSVNNNNPSNDVSKQTECLYETPSIRGHNRSKSKAATRKRLLKNSSKKKFLSLGSAKSVVSVIGVEPDSTSNCFHTRPLSTDGVDLPEKTERLIPCEGGVELDSVSQKNDVSLPVTMSLSHDSNIGKMKRQKLCKEHLKLTSKENIFQYRQENCVSEGTSEASIPSLKILSAKNRTKKRPNLLSTKNLNKRRKKKKILKEFMNLNHNFRSICLTPGATPSRQSKRLLDQKSPNLHLNFSPISNSQGSNNDIGKEVDVILSKLAASSPVASKKPEPLESASTSKPLDDILKDVVAHVQVRAKWEDRSQAVEEQLTRLGARISQSRKLTKDVTHLVFKDGQKGIYEKAFRKGVHIVSVLWVESCRQQKVRVPEHLFPAYLPVPETAEDDILKMPKAKRFRAMQPKDISAELDQSVEKVKEIVRRTLQESRNDHSANHDLSILTEKSQVPSDVLSTVEIPDSTSSVKIGKSKKTKKVPKPKELLLLATANDSLDFKPDVLSLMYSKKRKENNAKQNPFKPSRSLVLTSAKISEQEATYSIVNALGGFTLRNDVSDSTTHVVCGDHRRTFNLLLGLVRGCWILSPQWVYDSLENERWLDEEPYELSDFFPAVQISRTERTKKGPEYKQKLFDQVGNIYVSSSTSPPADKLTELIQLAGGKVVTSVRNCQVIVGSTYPSSAKKTFPCVTEKQILDCIVHNKPLTLEDFAF